MAVFIATPGHGYIKVTLREPLKALEAGYKPTNFSLMNGTHALLEEDVDAGKYMDSLGFDENWYGSLKTQYRKNNIDWSHYVTVANSKHELDQWMDVVNRRKDLKKGDEVVVFGKPYVIEKRLKSRGAIKYLVSGDQTGWTKATNIEGIRNG